MPWKWRSRPRSRAQNGRRLGRISSGRRRRLSNLGPASNGRHRPQADSDHCQLCGNRFAVVLTDSRIAGSRRPAVHAATRIADGFSPHRFGEKTSIAKRADKSRAAFRFGENGHDLVRVLQRDVDNIRGQHAAILKAHSANIRPLERLVPGRLQICQDTNADP